MRFKLNRTFISLFAVFLSGCLMPLSSDFHWTLSERKIFDYAAELKSIKCDPISTEVILKSPIAADMTESQFQNIKISFKEPFKRFEGNTISEYKVFRLNVDNPKKRKLCWEVYSVAGYFEEGGYRRGVFVPQCIFLDDSGREMRSELVRNWTGEYRFYEALSKKWVVDIPIDAKSVLVCMYGDTSLTGVPIGKSQTTNQTVTYAPGYKFTTTVNLSFDYFGYPSGILQARYVLKRK